MLYSADLDVMKIENCEELRRLIVRYGAVDIAKVMRDAKA